VTGDDTAWTEPADAVEVVAGFDGASGSEIVVLRRTAGGPWIVAGTEKVVDEATVARITGRAGQPTQLDLKVAEGARQLREQVVAWLEEHTGPNAKPFDLHLSEWQLDVLSRMFAEAISEGRLTIPYDARRIHGPR